MRKLTSQEVTDIAERAFKTFYQAAFAVIIADVSSVTNLNSAKVLALAAMAAGLSAVINSIHLSIS